MIYFVRFDHPLNKIVKYIAFGIILFFNPFQAAVFVLVLTGILAIAVGTILIIVAMKMKNFFRQMA